MSPFMPMAFWSMTSAERGRRTGRPLPVRRYPERNPCISKFPDKMNRARQINSVQKLPAGRKSSGWRWMLGCWLIALWFPTALFAQQQFQGVCAQVKIVIKQELTIERIGFDA